MPLVMLVIVALVYFSVGCVISTPYTILANGDVGDFMVTALLAPLALLILFITLFKGKAGYKKARKKIGLQPSFWVLISVFSLPVLANGASKLFMSIGWIELGKYAYEHRYISLMAVCLVWMVHRSAKDYLNAARLRLQWKRTPSFRRTAKSTPL